MAKRKQVKAPAKRKGADTRGLPGSKKGKGKTVGKNRTVKR
jgi:hypothetical protein